MTRQLYFIPSQKSRAQFLACFSTPTIIKEKRSVEHQTLNLKSLFLSQFFHHLDLIILNYLDMSQKSSFAVTCNLLSQYIKENRALADLGAAVRQPTTMSLMPGAEKDGEVGGKVARSMDLFPQRAGFGAAAAAPPAAAPAAAPAAVKEETDASNGSPGKSQLTIFYGGKVLVFDNFPAEKAKDLMQMAGKSSRPAAQNFLLPPPSAALAPASSKQLIVPATSTAVVQGSAAKPPQPSVSYLPIARNKSLHRFMEKRKERIQARAPYETTESPGKVKKEQEENLSWLGLGPKISSKPGLSSECS